MGCLVPSLGKLAAGVFGQAVLNLGQQVCRPGDGVHVALYRSWVHRSIPAALFHFGVPGS